MAKCLYSGDKPLGIVQSNAEDVAYEGNTSVKEKIESVASYRRVWNGSIYAIGDSFSITDFSTTKKYLAVFRSFTSGNYVNSFVFLGSQSDLQITFWGDSTQFVRYRIRRQSDNSYEIASDSVNTQSGNALLEVYEI